MDAVILHECESGKLIRICQRCLLYTDQYGNPDPTMYTEAQLRRFNKIPVHLRCPHQRDIKKTPAEYETLITVQRRKISRDRIEAK